MIPSLKIESLLGDCSKDLYFYKKSYISFLRYSYVDKEEKKKEYKPVAPKVEPKKLVRYRDNKIVSLKGERYTEIKRDDQEGDLKKPKQKNITQP